MKAVMVALVFGLCAGTVCAQSDPEAEHEALMAGQMQAFQSLNAAETATDQVSACDAYRQALPALKGQLASIARLAARLDGKNPDQASLKDHLKGMEADTRTAVVTAEAGIRRTCRK